MKKVIIFFLLSILYIITNSIGNELDIPIITKWYNDYETAVGLRFDDGLESHIKIVVPQLNEFNIKATFMINPARNSFLSSYKANEDFWEKQVPLMGHRLGNHTMHHKGADTIEEAEYEIGEVSKIIWKLYPDKSKLMVFASGGGEEWGGKRWSYADPEYRELTKKYNLIDLYDGSHPAVTINSETSVDELCKIVENAVTEKESVVFCFHQVGNPRIIDYLKKFLMNIDLTMSEQDFNEFIKYLDSKRDQIWIIPLIQLYKYEEEYNNSKLQLIKKTKKGLVCQLEVKTDPELYDQELSIKLPNENIGPNTHIKQDGENIKINHTEDSFSIINVKPINSIIEINY